MNSKVDKKKKSLKRKKSADGKSRSKVNQTMQHRSNSNNMPHGIPKASEANAQYYNVRTR
jgi:hypothetical protein